MSQTALPVAVIGAGPIGLAAAAHLHSRGETPVILEAGEYVGASVRKWGHVRLFSPWRYLVDTVAADMLERSGWKVPDLEGLPTGQELVERYLEPLAGLPQVKPHLRLGTRVVSVTRKGLDKMKDAGRDDAPFLLSVVTADGGEERLLAKAVIDASGTYEMPNPLGAGGVPAAGERAVSKRIFYGIPDVLGTDRGRYARRKVLVVGSGHSAFNALLELSILAEQEPDTRLLWAVRRGSVASLFGGEADDALPARGSLGTRLRQLVASGKVDLVTNFQVEALQFTEGGLTVVGEQETLTGIDEVVSTTGFRPDLTPLHELRLALDPSVESPAVLAPLIDPNLHSCGTVPPHGAAELKHPEKDFYLVDMKSYGRAPTFLMLTGYEQVRSVVCDLTGDVAGAGAVQLELPETGVCSGGEGSSCCAPTTVNPQAVTFEELTLLEVKG